MAIPAQGFTMTWAEAKLQGVSEFSISPPAAGDSAPSRDGEPPIDGGTVRLVSFEPIEKPTTGLPLNRDRLAQRLTISCMGKVLGGTRRKDFSQPIAIRLQPIVVIPDFPVNTGDRRITILDHICRYEGGTISAVTNDVLRFDHTFTILTVAETAT
jgi:hypothetical protein